MPSPPARAPLKTQGHPLSKDNPDPIGNMLAIPVLILIVVFGIWYMAGPKVVAFFFRISPTPFEFFSSLPIFTEATKAAYMDLALEMRSRTPAGYGWSALVEILGYWGRALNWILVPALLYFAARNWRLPVNYYYRRNLTLEQLARQSSERFPWTKIVIGKNLHKGDQYTGAWKTAYDFFDFAVINGLLDSMVGGTPTPIPPMAESKVRHLTLDKKRALLPNYKYVRLNIERTDALLCNQLGKPWLGVDSLEPHVRALAAAFMAMAAGGTHRNTGRKLLEQLARSVELPDIPGNEPRLDMRGVNEIIAQHENTERIRAIISKHAFVKTVLIALLVAARARAGKVPPSEFLWLRPVNRPLWYALHPIGGRKPWTEGMAAWAHYEAEMELGRSIATPVVSGMTDSFDAELHRERWVFCQAEHENESKTSAVLAELEEVERIEAEAARNRGQRIPGRM